MKKIMVFGDSNVEGAELLDHQIPGFPGPVGFGESLTAEGKAKLRWYMDNNIPRYHLMCRPGAIDEMKELTFTGQLKKDLTTTVENHGHGGSSMARIKLDLFKGVMSELKTNTANNLLVIFTNTSFDRYLHSYKGQYMNLVMGKTPGQYGRLGEIDGVMMRNWDDEFMLSLHFSAVLSCLDFLKSLGCNFLFIDSSFWTQQMNMVTSTRNKALKDLLQEVMDRAVLAKNQEPLMISTLARDLGIAKPLNPGRHFTHECHVAFGKQLAEYIKLKFPDFT